MDRSASSGLRFDSDSSADAHLVELSSADLPLDVRLKRFLIWAVMLLTAGYTFLDYWEYSRVEHNDPRSWVLLATGKGLAPAQYRIGVYFTANFIAHLTHLHFRHIFAVSDFLCVGFSLFCVFSLLTRIPWFRASSLSSQWSQVFLALLLTQAHLGWTFWFQEPETMPSLAILAASALICSGVLRVPGPVLAITLVLLAVLGATIRVDDVIALQAGIFLACLSSRTQLAGKRWLVVSAVVSLLAAFGIERFITHTLFPHSERSAPLVQLLANLHAFNGALALLCTLPPWALTVWLAGKSWAGLPLWLRGLVIGSVLEFLMFLTFGMSEEVRIFLPFTITLIPLSAVLLYGWFTNERCTA